METHHEGSRDEMRQKGSSKIYLKDKMSLQRTVLYCLKNRILRLLIESPFNYNNLLLGMW